MNKRKFSINNVMFLKHFVIILSVSAPEYNGMDTHYDTNMENKRVLKTG